LYSEYKNKILSQQNTTHHLNKILHPIREDIVGDFKNYRSDLFLVDYDLISAENREGIRSHDLADEVPENTSIEDKHILYQIYLLQQKNICKILSDYILEDTKILEIGCGVLDKMGDSFISAAFSRDVRSRFSFCDINPTMVKRSESNNSKANIQICDALKLDEEYAEKTFDIVIGHNAIDTLSSSDLATAFEQISKVLKDDGHLIHMMSLPPFIFSTIHNLCQQGEIVIPILKNNNISFCIIEKNKYAEKLRNKMIDAELSYITFLDYCATLSMNQMERLCNYLTQMSPVNLFDELIKWGNMVLPIENYIEVISQALSDSGFNTIENKLNSTCTDIHVQINGPYEGKFFEYGPLGKIIKNADDTNWGKSHLEIITHGIVAQKK